MEDPNISDVPMASIATWSVVEDISASCDQQKEVLDFIFLKELRYPLFQVSQNGIVPVNRWLRMLNFLLWSSLP